MASSRQVSVGGAAKVLLADISTLPGGPLLVIELPTGSATDVYIGGDGNELPANRSNGLGSVTSVTGYLLKAGSTLGPIRLNGNEAIYGITNTNTVTVHVFRYHGTP